MTCLLRLQNYSEEIAERDKNSNIPHSPTNLAPDAIYLLHGGDLYQK